MEREEREPVVTEEPEFVEDILDEEGGPEPGAAPEGGEQPAADPAAQAEPADQAGQPRDQQGRFAPKDQEQAGTSAPPAPAAGAASQTTTTEGEPFVFKADGQPWKIDGSRVTKDGVFIPTEHAETIRTLLAEGLAHRGSFQQKLAEKDQALEQAKRDRTFEVERANKLWDLILAKLDLPAEEIAAWLDDLAVNKPRLLAEAERAAIAKEREGFTSAQERERAEREQAELVPQLQSALETHAAAYAKKYPAVDPSVVVNKLKGNLGAVFFRADRDYPEVGLRKGEIAIDFDVLEAEFRFAQDIATRVGGARTAASSVDAANRAVLEGSPAPAAIGSSGHTPPAGEPRIPKFKTKKEADAYIESGKWRDL